MSNSDPSISPTPFKLSAQEVMLGIKVKDGRLVLRPSGLIRVGTFVDLFVGAVCGLTSVVLLAASLAWLPIGLLALLIIVEAASRIRVRIIADVEKVHIYNKWRSHTSRFLKRPTAPMKVGVLRRWCSSRLA